MKGSGTFDSSDILLQFEKSLGFTNINSHPYKLRETADD
jgi:hypothetical protein